MTCYTSQGDIVSADQIKAAVAKGTARIIYSRAFNHTSALSPALDNNLCGSSLAHHNCRYAGEVTALGVHKCKANSRSYELCEYADKGGLVHRECGIKVPN